MLLAGAILARVSSDGQHVTTQLEQLRAQARRDGVHVAPVHEYIDDGVSGAAGNLHRRTGLQQLLADLARRPAPWQVLYVWDFDRIARTDDPAEQGQILAALKHAGVELRTRNGTQPGLDTMLGRIWAVFQLEAAADWLQKHKDRVKAGKVRAYSLGRKPAGPTPYGLRYNRSSGAWSIDPGEAAVVREIYARVAAGEDCGSVANALELRGVPRARSSHWTRERVLILAKSPVYRGSWTVDKAKGWTLQVPAIVTPEEWEAAVAAIKRRGRRAGPRGRRVHLLEALLNCEVCGGSVGINYATRASGARVTYYYCINRRQVRHGCARCTLPMVLSSDLDAAVWGAVVELIATPGRLEEAIAVRRERAGEERRDWSGDVRTAEAQLADLARTDATILERYERGLVAAEVMDAHLERSRDRRQLLQRQLEAARRGAAEAGREQQVIDGVLATVATLRARLEDAEPAMRRTILQALVGPRRRLVLGADRSVSGDLVLDTRPVVVAPALGVAPTAAAGSSSGSAYDTRILLPIRAVA